MQTLFLYIILESILLPQGRQAKVTDKDASRMG